LISEITQWIMELMRTHGQLSVFIGVMIEQIIVPIPSPLIIMGAGAILISPALSIPNAFLQILWIIVLPGTIASTLGSYIGYLISFYGREGIGLTVPAFSGCRLESDRKFGETLPWKERSIEYLSHPGHSSLSYIPGVDLCRTSQGSH
jgi:membrane protein DedA with SNARE-associated domain